MSQFHSSVRVPKMSLRTVLLCLCLWLTTLQSNAADSLGSVLLDEVIFDKIISRFQVALVKFDTAFPYGDKHDEYSRFAKEQNVLVKDLVIADVHVKDYGSKDNYSLLKRFGLTEKDLPTILLLKAASADPSKWLRYPQDATVTVDSLKNFVRRNTKLYIGLSGCIEEFDVLAAEFMSRFNRNEDMDKIIERATDLLPEIREDPEKEKMGHVYLQIMNKIREKGISFKDDEKSRVGKLLKTASKLTPQKKRELEDRLNVLLSFRDITLSSSESSSEKSEL